MGGDFIAKLFSFLQVNTPHISRLLPFAGLGAYFITRLFFIGCEKKTSAELEYEYPALQGFNELHKKSYWLVILGVGAGALFINFANQVNLHIWEDPSFLLFAVLVISVALNDGIFTFKTNIFPTTSRYKRDWYYYDKDQEYRWVAYFQIGIAVFLLLIDVSLLIFLAI